MTANARNGMVGAAIIKIVKPPNEIAIERRAPNLLMSIGA
jgi:hypothetical protein